MTDFEYRPSSELQRAAEEAERNMARRIEWARKVYERSGRWPSLAPCGAWRRILELRMQRAVERRAAQRAQAEAHGNRNVIPFPRRRRQYMHTRLPEPPEVA